MTTNVSLTRSSNNSQYYSISKIVLLSLLSLSLVYFSATSETTVSFGGIRQYYHNKLLSNGIIPTPSFRKLIPGLEDWGKVLDPRNILMTESAFHAAYNYSSTSKSLGKGFSGASVVIGTKKSNPSSKVAIKTTPLEFNETQTALNLDHPNIIDIHNVAPSREANALLIAMESADKYGALKKSRSLVNITAEWLQSALYNLTSAVLFIHETGWSHNDLWLKNIVLSNDRVVKIIDFGMANRSVEDRPSDVFKLGVSFTTLSFGHEFMNGIDIEEFQHKEYLYSKLNNTECPLASLLTQMMDLKVDIKAVANHAYFNASTSAKCDDWRIQLGERMRSEVKLMEAAAANTTTTVEPIRNATRYLPAINTAGSTLLSSSSLKLLLFVLILIYTSKNIYRFWM